MGSRLVVALLLLAAAGCRPGPKYSQFRSPFADFVCQVPSGWKTIVDSTGNDYYQVSFLGPFEPNFYKGVPSLSVRWFRFNQPHKLPDGSYEMYSSAQDFMEQMRRDIYGPDGYYKAGDDKEQQNHMARGEALPDFETIKMQGDLPAAFFVAYHNLAAPAGATYGVVSDDAGHRIVRERHGYVVLPVRSGLYVLTYPATRGGYEVHKMSFIALIKTFKLLREGPR